MHQEKAERRRSSDESNSVAIEAKDDGALTGTSNRKNWLWPLHGVKILDIRNMRDEKDTNSKIRHNYAEGSHKEIKTKSRKINTIKYDTRSSLMKLGMNIDDEQMLFEDNINADSQKSSEGSKPRLYWSHKNVQNNATEKRTNVFHARSRDAGISASWTRFSGQNDIESDRVDEGPTKKKQNICAT